MGHSTAGAAVPGTVVLPTAGAAVPGTVVLPTAGAAVPGTVVLPAAGAAVPGTVVLPAPGALRRQAGLDRRRWATGSGDRHASPSPSSARCPPSIGTSRST